ncbi:MAG: hypothetical protein V4707_08205 [Pseudomonadota bacterium]
MTPTLIVIILGIIAVGVVVWAVRRKPARPYEQRLEQDTAWNDPVSSDKATPPDGDQRP